MCTCFAGGHAFLFELALQVAEQLAPVLAGVGHVAPVGEEVHQGGAAHTIAVHLHDGDFIVIVALFQATVIGAGRKRLPQKIVSGVVNFAAVLAALGEGGLAQCTQAIEEVVVHVVTRRDLAR